MAGSCLLVATGSVDTALGSRRVVSDGMLVLPLGWRYNGPGCADCRCVMGSKCRVDDARLLQVLKSHVEGCSVGRRCEI